MNYEKPWKGKTKMGKTAGIVGAGVMGRLLALELNEHGWDVTIFDRNGVEGRDSCSWTGAGMIAPYCELEAAERVITQLGVQSASRWPAIIKRLPTPVYYHSRGSLVVAHPRDRNELERLRRRVNENAPRPDIMSEINGKELGELEPDLSGRFLTGLYFPFEQHMDNRGLLHSMAEGLNQRGVSLVTEYSAETIAPNRIGRGSSDQSFDWVIDCRGMGAKHDMAELRGVRGELIYLHAPEVNLSRPVRLMHPRYSIYIVPRPDDIYVVGATAIESDDESGTIAVRSALELLSAAYTVHTGFAEGRMLEASVACRPAFPDNHPRIHTEDGLIRINGLYRHGFLISPALTDFVIGYMENGEIKKEAEKLFRHQTAVN